MIDNTQNDRAEWWFFGYAFTCMGAGYLYLLSVYVRSLP